MSIRNTLRSRSVFIAAGALMSLSAACAGEVGDEEVLGTLTEALMVSWDTAFSDANGWNGVSHYTTIQLADVSNDGKADVCGRGGGGIYCGVSSGSSFGAPTLWNGSFSNANGWGSVQYYSTIRFPNVGGSAAKDVCGRGGGGINCALSSGATFGATSVWSSAFSDANGWNAEKYYATIDFPDVNNDGKADVCGRGGGGINCALSSGAAFGAASVWNASFSDSNGWTSPQYYRTIRYPNVNGAGGADVCGRGGGGIFCATSTGAAFGAATLWSSAFSDAHGWADVKYYSTIAFPDVNGDGKADVCGRGSGGVNCAISTGATFSAATLWSNSFSDANGWGTEPYYSTISFPDLNQDGKADLCGRGSLGLYCAFSNGSSFLGMGLVESDISDAGGWNQAKHYKTLRFANLDSDSTPEMCGRGGAGMFCKNFF